MEENTSKPICGTKYYRYVNDQLIRIRLLKVKNDNCYVVESNGYKFNMTKTEFRTYEKLKPDGYVAFSIAQLEGGVKDVITAFYRKQDIASREQEAFAVCRMNIYDLFTNAINQDKEIIYIGCSANRDNCPQNVDFKIMLACNGIEKMDMVAVYIEDSLDDILKLVNTVAYDDVLYTLEKGYVKSKTKGACSSLKQLLEQNHFIDDVYYGFKEMRVQFKYIAEVASELIHAIEDQIKHRMLNAVWIKFDRDIDLTKIEGKYIIVRDTEDDLYIVSYDEGEYVNRPYFAMGDSTEYDMMNNLSLK